MLNLWPREKEGHRGIDRGRPQSVSLWLISSALVHDFLCFTYFAYLITHAPVFWQLFTKPPLQFFPFPPPFSSYFPIFFFLCLPCLFVRFVSSVGSAASASACVAASVLRLRVRFSLLIDVSTYLVYFAHFRTCWKILEFFLQNLFQFLSHFCYFFWAACAFACPPLSLSLCDRLALLLIFINKPLCVQQ